MGLIAVIHVEHERLTLAPTVEQVPSVDVRIVTNSMTDPDSELFFFRVRSESGAFEAFETALEQDPTVADAVVISESEHTRMYRFKHLSGTELLSPKVAELGGLILEAKGDETGWQLRLQLPDRAAIERLWEHCLDEGMSFELVRVFEQHNLDSTAATSVSSEQRVALVEAYRSGYFEEPREITQSELAERFDIGSTALGGRIRRGTGQLVEDVLLDEEVGKQS